VNVNVVVVARYDFPLSTSRKKRANSHEPQFPLCKRGCTTGSCSVGREPNI